tara:strand:- start:355 stop:561 length:207 start_codon:yes stop_codon:yes gene_type:complete
MLNEVEVLKRNVEELQGQLHEQYKKVVELLGEINELETAAEQHEKMAESFRRVGANNAQEQGNERTKE